MAQELRFTWHFCVSRNSKSPLVPSSLDPGGQQKLEGLPVVQAGRRGCRSRPKPLSARSKAPPPQATSTAQLWELAGPDLVCAAKQPHKAIVVCDGASSIQRGPTHIRGMAAQERSRSDLGRVGQSANHRSVTVMWRQWLPSLFPFMSKLCPRCGQDSSAKSEVSHSCSTGFRSP